MNASSAATNASTMDGSKCVQASFTMIALAMS